MNAERPSLSLSRYLFERLSQLGIKNIFGISGDYTLQLLNELEANGRPHWVGNASETGATYMADGYARTAGLSVLITTYGIGELSVLSGIAGALAEDVGILQIVGAPPADKANALPTRRYSFTDNDSRHFSRIAGEFNHEHVTAGKDTAIADIDRALISWRNSRRPTCLKIPQDLASMPVERAPLDTPLLKPKPAEELSRINAAEELTRHYFTKYPNAAGLIGNLTARWGLRSRIRGLSQRKIPVAVLPKAKSVINESSQSYLGIYNGELTQPDARAILEAPTGRVLLGCSLADTGAEKRFSPNSTLTVNHDVISWDGIRISRIPFTKLTEIVCQQWPNPSQTGHLPIYQPTIAAQTPDSTRALTHQDLWATIADTLPPGYQLYAETSTSLWGALDIQMPDNTTFETSPVWAPTGYAIPASIGAAAADPTRRVLLVADDSAAQMSSQELGIIGRAHLNPILILLNNSGSATDRPQRASEGAGVCRWKWDLLPKAYGISDNTITTVTANNTYIFTNALNSAFQDTTRAHLIEAVTVLDSTAGPSVVRQAQQPVNG